MDSNKFADYEDYKKCCPKFQANFVGDGKDAASLNWGEKWRIPTKAEFEELIEKCLWKKAVTPKSNKNALKITGPNGNYIYFLNESKNNQYWTSTEFNKFPNHDQKFVYVFRNFENMRANYWLETPIDKRLKTPLPDDIQQQYDVKYESMRFWWACTACHIRPVADKKWKGKM